jgi:putative ABC transport system ATP-binding protein
MKMRTALESQAVIKQYQAGSSTVNAVDGVSFSLQPGEFVALVGPSGSGKTTMLAMLAGLLQPTSGSVIVDGQALSAMKEKERARFRRRKIGFTFQANNLVPYLTTLENVELMLRLNHQFDAAGRKRARELLVLLGLEERLNVLPRQLSGGQQQRVAIARSLINRPAVVLADEPTASLDSERAFQVVETLANLVHEQDSAGIMVTHDLRMVEYADRIIHMLDGRVEQILTPEDDLSCLANPADCRMIPADNLLFGEPRSSQPETTLATGDVWQWQPSFGAS